MKKSYVRFLVLSVLAFAFISFIPSSAFAATTTWLVPGDNSNTCTTVTPDCNTIQAAVAAAASGDTINVAAGTYTGDLTIPAISNLTIAGAGAGSTILNLDPSVGYGVSLDNGGPATTGFTLSGFTVNASTGTIYALKAYKADGLTLTNDTFVGGTGNTGGGVDINTTSNVTFNNVSSSGFHKNGFAVTSAYTSGDASTPSHSITFNGITSTGNGWTGISFYTVGNAGGSASIGNVTFTGTNTISGNTAAGIFLEGDSDANFATFANPANTITSDGTTLNLTNGVFSGNPVADIVNYQTAPVNAIGTTFAGLTGDAMSTGQRTTEDSLIIDHLDHSNLGLVSYYDLPSVTTNPATSITTSDATLNGTNGSVAAGQESFWVSLSPFVTTSSSIPAGVYSTPVLPGVTANSAFSDPLSLVTTQGIPSNLPAITPGTTYYYVAWANVNGTWVPGVVQSFNTLSTPECNTNATQTILSDASTKYNGGNSTVLVPNPAWTTIAGASWIWGTDGSTDDTTVAKTEDFSRDFTIVGTPTTATLNLSSDNGYVVKVNGNVVDSQNVDPANELSYQSVHTYNISSYITTGINTLEIDVTNFGRAGTTFSSNPAGLIYSLTVGNNECVIPPAPTTATVHIFKFINGVQATSANANDVSFPMFTSTYNAPFTLGPAGYNTGDIPYEASTNPIAVGSSYSTNEDTTGSLVGASCDGTHSYALTGYTTGSNLGQAENAALSPTTPSLTNLQGDQYIIVWNTTCQVTPPIKVHILKYLDGAEATAVSAKNYLFPMVSSWNAANIGAGSGSYTLGNNFGGAPKLYGADTAPMSVPANYSTSEVTDGSGSKVVSLPESCVPGDYLLNGYHTSTLSFADAATQPLLTTPPAFTGLNADQYVIVDNSSCPTTGSLTIVKDTIGGNGTFTFTSDIPGNPSFSITTTGANTGGTGSSQTFSNLTPGTYHVTEGAVKGWTSTDNECASVTVNAGDPVLCTITNTNNKLLGEIRGTKYEDRDGDGKLSDGDHHRLAGVTVYLDTNHNGQLDNGEPSTITDNHGEYRFTGLVAGTYYVREVVQSGWTETYPSNDAYTINLSAGQIAKKKDFGNFKLATISGMKYDDKNGNGHKNSGEEGLQGWTIDLKGPHGLSTSTVTDANGDYSFANLGPGLYKLSEVMQSGWKQTAHPWPVEVKSGTNSKNNNFGNHEVTVKQGGGGDNDNDWDDNNGHQS